MTETSTLTASLKAVRLAAILNQKRQQDLARVAREIEADRRRQEQDRRQREKETAQPTPERLAKGDVGQHIIRGEGRKFRTKSPVEHYSGQWPSEVEQAFLAYILDAHAKDRVSVTISYNSNGGGSAHGRLGGLGNVHDKTRDAYERYEFVRQRLTVEAVQIMDWLVLELKAEASAQAMSLEVVGQRLMPSIRDKATRKGIAIGALLMAGRELGKCLRLFHVLSADRRREREMRDVTP